MHTYFLTIATTTTTRHQGGCTPLFLACQHGRLKCVQALLAHNADPAIAKTGKLSALVLLLATAEDFPYADTNVHGVQQVECASLWKRSVNANGDNPGISRNAQGLRLC
eukprot:1161661-Pelagomonas_calceolata.AAC.5